MYSDYGQLVSTGMHGSRENFSPRGEYIGMGKYFTKAGCNVCYIYKGIISIFPKTGNQHEQAQLWWKEAKELETQISIAKLVEKTSQLVSRLDKLPIPTSERRKVLRGVLKMLCDEIALRFPKEPLYLPEEFVTKIQMTMGGMGDEMKMADMTYSVNCPITGTILGNCSDLPGTDSKCKNFRNYKKKMIPDNCGA